MNSTLKLWLTAFTALSISLCKGATSAPEPRIVIQNFRSSNPGVLSWDCPVFVAYSDGAVIWRRGWEKSLDSFVTTRSARADDLVAVIENTIGAYAGKTFTLTESSEAEVTTIWISGKTTTVLGDWRTSRQISPSENDEGREHLTWLPPKIREVLATVAKFDDPDQRPWHPRVQLLLQPPTEVQVEPVQWPSNWPQSFDNVKGSLMKTIEFPPSMLDNILKLLPDDGTPRAITVNGESRYVEIHFIFPEQMVWRSGKNRR